MKIHLETERLILRDIISTDVDGLFELDSNPNVHTYLGNKPVENIDQSREVIKAIQQQYRENGIGRWAIIDKETKDFIGWTGLKLVTEKINSHIGFYDLGYRLLEKYWGKGIATETANATLKYAFTKLNLLEVYAMCDIENIGSKNVLEKAGFSFIESFDYNGIEHNWFKITKGEWNGKQILNAKL
ncbi:MAG: GNAT family N-acetyltransferase [Arcicella sp.]|nr:GNAT family N-acetyltransferase [Arcicella sp.]